MNKFPHIQLFTTTTTALTQKFLRELRKKHAISETVFLVDHAHNFSAALNRAGLQFQTVRNGNRNAVERVFRKIKCRTSSFNSSFSHVDPATTETWLQSFAVWSNSLNYLTSHVRRRCPRFLALARQCFGSGC